MLRPTPWPASRLAGPALISRSTAAQLGIADGSSRGFLTLASGSDCVLATAVVQDGRVAHGQVAVTAVQQFNLHLGAGISDDFRSAPLRPTCFLLASCRRISIRCS